MAATTNLQPSDAKCLAETEAEQPTEQSESVWQLLFDAHNSDEAVPAPRRVHGMFIGEFVGQSEQGEPLVRVPEVSADQSLVARSIASYQQSDAGRPVVIQFEQSDATKPILMGFLHSPMQNNSVQVERDGERLEFSAEREIVFRCGKSSITLTRAGKILIRGTYLLSRSSGVNRIKGGSVQLN